MGRQYNLLAFYLCIFCVALCFSSIYSNISLSWSVAPPVDIMLIIATASFVTGIIGFKYRKNWQAVIRSWFTVLISVLLSIILLLFVVFYSEGYQLINIAHSPDKHYTINLYRTNGGATTSFGIKGELNGPLWFKKPIYSQNRMDQAEIEWKNNYTVSINNHILNLKKGETYSD